jgi:hypothetical protein
VRFNEREDPMKSSHFRSTWFSVSTYLTLISSFALAIYIFGWTKFWNFLRIPTMYPFFADLRNIQGALISSKGGLNPQLTNPGDPWKRSLDYPSIWVSIAKALHLDHEINFTIFGICIILLFVASCCALIRESRSFFVTMACLSSCSILGIERCNIDLLIFTLVFIAVSLNGRFGNSIIFIASILKIFPIYIYVFLRKSTFSIFWMFCVISYLIVIRKQLLYINHNNTAGGSGSYGLDQVSNATHELIPKFLLAGSFYSKVIPLIIIILVAVITARLIPNVHFDGNLKKRNLFKAGGMLYVLTYLSAENWDYRLSFLILCMPLVATLENKLTRYLFLFLSLISMNQIWIDRCLIDFFHAGDVTILTKFLLVPYLIALLFRMEFQDKFEMRMSDIRRRFLCFRR